MKKIIYLIIALCLYKLFIKEYDIVLLAYENEEKNIRSCLHIGIISAFMPKKWKRMMKVKTEVSEGENMNKVKKIIVSKCGKNGAIIIIITSCFVRQRPERHYSYHQV